MHSSAQLPPQLTVPTYYQCIQNTGVSIPSASEAQMDLTSDGQGNHIVFPNSTDSIQYYLLDEKGSVVRSTTFGANASHPSITSRLGILNVALMNSSNNQLELWRSSNGGVTWGMFDFRPASGTMGNIDSYEDQNGVHITYSSSTGLYYHLRQSAVWANYPTQLPVTGNSASNPTVIGTTGSVGVGDSAHIIARQGLWSLYLNSSGGGSWNQRPLHGFVPEPEYATFAVALSAGGVTPPFNRYMFLLCNQFHSSLDQSFRRFYKLYDQQGDWGGAANPTNDDALSQPQAVVTSAYPYGLQWVHFLAHDDQGIWHNRIQANNSSQFVYRNFVDRDEEAGSQCELTGFQLGTNPTLGYRPGSLAFTWRRSSDGQLLFRRKPIGIDGVFFENYALNDTNWIIGETIVQTGKELRLKSGSITYIIGKWYDGFVGASGPGKLVISPGASLVVEPGSKLYLESPTEGTTQGGTLELGTNVVATIYGTVEAKPGSKFRFGDGASMNIVNGEFKAKGSSYTNPVIFERTGTGTWDGLVFTGASIRNDTIEYARFSNTKTALSLQSKSTLRLASTVFDNSIIGVEVVNTPGDMYREIKNCAFNGITGTGISITDDSNILLDTDTLNISGSNTKGIFLSSASPKILRTRIYTATIGLHCTNASSPVLEEGVPGGNNKFENNSNSVMCQSSDAVLGFISGAMGDLGGQNSFEQPANTVFGTATGGSIVLAENNWWGKAKPDVGNWFLADDESSVDFIPFLTANPNPGASILLSPAMSPGEDLMREALQHRAEGEFAQSLQAIKAMITSSTVSPQLKKWAVRQLVAMSHRLPGDRLSEYLGTILSNQPALLRQIKGVMPNILQSEGSVSEAQTAYTANIQEYPNSDVECAALYGKFIHALYANKDISAATSLKALLDNRYPESGEASMAGLQLQNYPGFSQSQQLALGKGEPANSTPNRFTLEQNYPNPFNPSTTINYELPTNNWVTLKVFDVLGREVASLVDEFIAAGQHSVTFDARSLSSGFYFYRLNAGSFTATRKLLLVR